MAAERRPEIALVTGAGRGLGFEFVRQWVARGDRVFALARDPEGSKRLQDLRRSRPETVAVLRCDVTSDAGIEAARREVERAAGRLDVVVNNAGTFGGEDETLESLDLDTARRVFDTNTLGPIRVSRAFLPLLRKSPRPRLVHITSGLGSVDDNRSGGHWTYRMSKTALNMASRNLAIELHDRGVVSTVLSPGWVRTDMGGSDAPLSAEEAVAAMIATIDRLETRHSGASLDRFGKPAPA
jgi:NAD(P)-dependent dehydrogenase (short-subunit alcohol dehydrogenase family)